MISFFYNIFMILLYLMLQTVVLFTDLINVHCFTISYQFASFFITSLTLHHSNTFFLFMILFSSIIHFVKSSRLISLSIALSGIMFSILLNLYLANKTTLLWFSFFFLNVEGSLAILLLIENIMLRVRLMYQNSTK